MKIKGYKVILGEKYTETEWCDGGSLMGSFSCKCTYQKYSVPKLGISGNLQVYESKTQAEYREEIEEEIEKCLLKRKGEYIG